jgi:branched-chain amino acid transport system substrate-binding protein
MGEELVKAAAGETAVTNGRSSMPKRLALLFVAPLVLLTAACGSSSSSTSTTQTTASTGTGSLTKAPILIGEVGPFSGAQSGLGGEDVAQAWESWTNAHGGVAGHPVKVLFGDDQSTGALDSSLVLNLAQNEHVDAFLSVGEADNQALAYLTAHDIPVMLSESLTPTSNDINLTASQAAVTTGLIQSVKLAGKNSVGVFYCTAASFCKQAVDPFEVAAKKYNLDHSFKVGISLDAPNFTAECYAAKDEHVEALFAEADAATVQRIAQECAVQGYKPIYLLDGVQAALSMAKIPAMNGARNIVTTFPWFEDDTPATQAFQDALRQYDPALLKSTEFGPLVALAWANAQAVAEGAVLGNVGANPTPEAVLAGLHKFNKETLGGLIAPVTWKPNQTALTNCYFVVATKDGKWVAPSGFGPQCAS